MEQIMNMETLMQLVTYALMVVGLLAFVVSMVVQVIKEMPFLVKLPTNVVALVVSLILCPVAGSGCTKCGRELNIIINNAGAFGLRF